MSCLARSGTNEKTNGRTETSLLLGVDRSHEGLDLRTGDDDPAYLMPGLEASNAIFSSFGRSPVGRHYPLALSLVRIWRRLRGTRFLEQFLIVVCRRSSKFGC